MPIKTPKIDKKKAFKTVSKMLLDQYDRNLITLEEYKTQMAFAKGRYGIR